MLRKLRTWRPPRRRGLRLLCLRWWAAPTGAVCRRRHPSLARRRSARARARARPVVLLGLRLSTSGARRCWRCRSRRVARFPFLRVSPSLSARATAMALAGIQRRSGGLFLLWLLPLAPRSLPLRSRFPRVLPRVCPPQTPPRPLVPVRSAKIPQSIAHKLRQQWRLMVMVGRCG